MRLFPTVPNFGFAKFSNPKSLDRRVCQSLPIVLRKYLCPIFFYRAVPERQQFFPLQSPRQRYSRTCCHRETLSSEQATDAYPRFETPIRADPPSHTVPCPTR